MGMSPPPVKSTGETTALPSQLYYGSFVKNWFQSLGSAKLVWIPNTQKSEDKKCHYFKTVSFGTTCFKAVDNYT